MNKKIICFDLDNVVCKTKKNHYHKSLPIKKNIKIINKLYSKGFIIKIFTARFMGRSKENTSIAKKKGFNLTTKQLNKWNVKYHHLIFGKPSFDLYIDDKNLNFRRNWAKDLEKKYL